MADPFNDGMLKGAARSDPEKDRSAFCQIFQSPLKNDQVQQNKTSEVDFQFIKTAKTRKS
jgi:hypothetical protein